MVEGFLGTPLFFIKEVINIQTLYHYITLALIKMCDNVITTEKSILTHQNKAMAASVLVAVSQFIFYSLIKEVVADSNPISIIVVSVASGIGSYIAFCINNKFSKETVYINIVTSNDKAKMKDFGDHMRAEGIKIVTMPTYGDDIEKTLTALVFANTRDQSKKIDKYIANNGGLFREVIN
jgi:uncharacterized protein YebE (UPF0316 family)